MLALCYSQPGNVPPQVAAAFSSAAEVSAQRRVAQQKAAAQWPGEMPQYGTPVRRLQRTRASQQSACCRLPPPVQLHDDGFRAAEKLRYKVCSR